VPLVLLLSVVLVLLWPITAIAEWYVSGYGGPSHPGALTNVTLSNPGLNGGVTNAHINDLEMKTSPAGGLKAGYFFSSRPWLGIEADAFTLNPKVKQQGVVSGSTRGPVLVDTLQEIPLRLTTVAANIIIRSPSLSEDFQPYAGMGYAVFIAQSSQGGGESNLHLSHGFNIVAGARYMLTEKWALLGEFKYNRTTLQFSGVRGNFDANMFILGVVRHFGK
jgi:outer membrane protein W